MTLTISERGKNLLLLIIQDLTAEQLEYDEEDGGMPRCVYCKQVSVQPGIVQHTYNCLNVLALELAKEMSKGQKQHAL